MSGQAASTDLRFSLLIPSLIDSYFSRVPYHPASVRVFWLLLLEFNPPLFFPTPSPPDLPLFFRSPLFFSSRPRIPPIFVQTNRYLDPCRTLDFCCFPDPTPPLEKRYSHLCLILVPLASIPLFFLPAALRTGPFLLGWHGRYFPLPYFLFLR